MTTFSPGDIVDVTITGVRVAELLADGGISVIMSNGDFQWVRELPEITITRRAPQPQADLTAAYQELREAVKEWQDAEAVKLARTMDHLAEIIRAKTDAPFPADAEAV